MNRYFLTDLYSTLVIMTHSLSMAKILKLVIRVTLVLLELILRFALHIRNHC